jgi:hypothetical protein
LIVILILFYNNMISGEAKKMIFIFLTHPRDLSGVYNRMTTQVPTMEQVINYVRENPDCKSKDIAKHFGCTTKDINRNRGEYIGIYSNPAIISTDYKHRVKETEHEPEPEGNMCPICLEPPTNPVSGGCCPYPMCRECFIELKNSDSENSDKCPHCRETFPWAVPDNRARLMPDQDQIDRSAEEWHRLQTENQSLREARANLQRHRSRLSQRLASYRELHGALPDPIEPEPEPVATWGALTLTGDAARRHLAQTTPEESEATAEQTRQRLPVRLRVRNDND